MRKSYLILLFSILTALIPRMTEAQSVKSAGTGHVEKFDPGRDAAADIRAAIREASMSNRRILLDVGGEWCVWCRRLDSLFINNHDLADFMSRNFVAVKINFSKENENEAVLSNYPEIKGYPHIFVLEKDGTLLHSQDTGELESGKGHSRDKVFDFLRKWAITPETLPNEFEMKDGDTTYTMKKYFFCLLKKGPNRNQDSSSVRDIQKNHLAHLDKLGKMGLISIAGPFEAEHEYRGILIFNVSTQEEAERLEGDDPAVISGRLSMEILPVWLAKGSKLP